MWLLGLHVLLHAWRKGCMHGERVACDYVDCKTNVEAEGDPAL